MTEAVSSSSAGIDISLLKLDFMRIVCSHEHYITLNLPFNISLVPSNPPSPTSSIASSTSQASLLSGQTSSDKMPLTDVTDEFRVRHFLTGIILSDLSTMLDSRLKYVNCWLEY